MRMRGLFEKYQPLRMFEMFAASGALIRSGRCLVCLRTDAIRACPSLFGLAPPTSELPTTCTNCSLDSTTTQGTNLAAQIRSVNTSRSARYLANNLQMGKQLFRRVSPGGPAITVGRNFEKPCANRLVRLTPTYMALDLSGSEWHAKKNDWSLRASFMHRWRCSGSGEASLRPRLNIMSGNEPLRSCQRKT